MGVSTVYFTKDDPRNQLKTMRAGVIPYTIGKDGQIMICLGRDRNSNELCDFGGGIHMCEHTVNGAFREFCEETLGIFNSEITLKKLFNESITIKSHRNTLFFIHVGSSTAFLSSRKFLRLSKERGCESLPSSTGVNEISEIVWIPLAKFVSLVFFKCEDDTMWVRIAKFLQKTIGNMIEDTFPKFLIENKNMAVTTKS